VASLRRSSPGPDLGHKTHSNFVSSLRAPNTVFLPSPPSWLSCSGFLTGGHHKCSGIGVIVELEGPLSSCLQVKGTSVFMREHMVAVYSPGPLKAARNYKTAVEVERWSDS
jgi:hypothetical protein